MLCFVINEMHKNVFMSMYALIFGIVLMRVVKQ